MKKLIAILALVLVATLPLSVSASSWTSDPFEKKLPKQSVNKSVMGKNSLWLKHTGSANSPVCGITICKTTTSSLSIVPDGSYPLKAKIPRK